MPAELRLLCVLAHPDDESLGTGGILAKCSREGIGTYIVTATRGERGRFDDKGTKPGLQVVGRAREAELRAAAKELGVREVSLLDYLDAELDRADPIEAAKKIADHIRRIKPQVVVTFDPFGAYGHPDHIAISQLAAAAIVTAADPAFATQGADGGRSHAVSKLYYIAWPQSTWAAYQSAFKTLTSTVDGVERQTVPWPDWAITTRIDTRSLWPAVWRAVSCHESQMAAYEKLGELSPAHHEALWGSQSFYRAFSAVNVGRTPETDLFEGIR
jgi:LmbE family N-acetylglucosaminyl deacetylase